MSESPADNNPSGSDAQLSGADASQSPLAAEPPRTAHESGSSPAIQSVTCPSCDAVLRNVSVQAGGTVRCLNCGKRFMADGSDRAPISPSGERSAALKNPVSREPRAAGYWLLRIPSIILYVVSLFGFALLLWNSTSFLSFGRFYEIVWFSYWPLIPFAGMSLFLFSRALARIDAGSVFLAWRLGVIKDSLPPVTGSSLPFIAPLAVSGGVLPIVCVRADPDSMESVLVGGFYGALFFYGGFALEDVRQFIWRQQTLAKNCCERFGVDSKLINTRQISGMSGWLIGCVLVSISVVIISQVFRMYSWRPRQAQDIIPIFFALAFAVISVSFVILGCAWDRAVAWWQLAAGLAENQSSAYIWEKSTRELPTGMRHFVFAPMVWLVCGTLWMVAMLLSKEFRGINGWEGITILFLCLGGACLAAWLARFLAQVVRWRDAQQAVWAKLQNKAMIQSPPHTGIYWHVVWGTVFLACTQAVLFGIFMLENIRRIDLESAGFPLLVFMMHYPTIWLAMLLGETLGLEMFLASRRNIGSDGNSVEFENTDLA